MLVKRYRVFNTCSSIWRRRQSQQHGHLPPTQCQWNCL